MESKIHMSKKQLKQAHVIRKYNEGLLSRSEAAKAIRLSERQVTRLSKEMKEKCESALIHKNTGRKPAHAITEEERNRIVEIRKESVYDKCNIRHFNELLERKYGIKISYCALYNLLKDAGIKSPKKRLNKVKHRRRKRRASAGELGQIDATPYDWLGTGTRYALHGSIDDATGVITGLYMTENECFQGYFEVTRQTILGFGVPLSMYSDKHTIFRSPLTSKKEEAGEEANLTQFGRALAELGVNIIYAHSPQAKGRIERAWETLQSRLPVEFKLAGITTIEDANKFLKETFIPMFNTRFAVEAEAEPIFVPFVHRNEIDNILCVKEERKTDNAGSFSFKGQRFKVLDEGCPLIPAKASVEVLVSVRDSIRVRYKGRIFRTVVYTKTELPKESRIPKKVTLPDIEYHTKPYLYHGTDAWKKVWHYESYADSLAFLYEVFFKYLA